MIPFLWTAAKGYRLKPWRSPYLLWRIETYQGTPAAGITFRQFWRFVWEKRADTWRMLRWVQRNR